MSIYPLLLAVHIAGGLGAVLIGIAPVLPPKGGRAHSLTGRAFASNYVVIHWRDREGLLRETLQTLEARLAPHGFARGHRSTLVSLARVRALKPLSDGAWRITLDSGTELVVSRSYRDDLLARLKTPRPAPLPEPS